MEQYEVYFEENSDNVVEVEQEEVVVGVVGPQPVNIPLEVVVPGVADNPESPSLPFASPSSVLGSPIHQPWDAPSFMGFFTSDNLIDLGKWTVDAPSLRGTPDLRLEEPEISPNLKTLLRYTWGAQWEHKLIQPSGEVLICQLRPYLAGYNLMTSFNRRQLLRLFRAWTVQERREQLELLVASGVLLEL